ncbi:MAG: DUF2946 family protein [Proteobacteria bacterium]|nr:DUF2946 family protein [Pseudomonadota bacterium]
MPSPTASPAISARAERRAIVALLAMFALLLQALAPVTALANTNAFGGEVICTATGTAHAQPGAPGQAPAPGGHHQGGCDHCVCPVAAAPPPDPSGVSSIAVRYAVAVDHPGLGAETCAPGRGLAAPPPPSRGPPASTI